MTITAVFLIWEKVQMAKRRNKRAWNDAVRHDVIGHEAFDPKSEVGKPENIRSERAGRTATDDLRHESTGSNSVKSRRSISYAGHEANTMPGNEAKETFIQKEPVQESRSERISRTVNQEFFDKHDAEDDRNIEYVSQREETRARRIYRHRGRKKAAQEYIKPEADFDKKADFVEEAGAEISDDRRLDRLEQKAEKAAEKTEKARNRLPRRKEYRLVRQFDETTGKVTYELETYKVPKKPKRDNPVTAAGRRAKMEAQGFVHQKIAENEKENAGVEGAHKTEQAAEEAVYYVGRLKGDKSARKVKKVAAAERKQFKAETEFRFQKFLEENPEVKKKAFRKFLQKQRIKREYAKAVKKGTQQAKEAAGYARKAAQTTTAIAKKIQEFLVKHIGVIGAIAAFGLIFVMIATGISSCGAMFGGGVATTMMGSYQSLPAELDKSDDAMTIRELELQNKIDNIETDYPSYDEYEYNLDEIGHDPFVLISYLSALNIDFAAIDVDDQIQGLFDLMYTLTLTPRIDIRTRTVTDPDTGESFEEEYEVRVLEVELKSKKMEEVVEHILSGEEADLYHTYMETRGALQQFYTPLDLDWYSQIKSYYGYRKNPITGENQFHRGIDIAVPEGTLVYAAQDGTVQAATYDADYGNYIVIADAANYVTKYAHLESMAVSAGEDVKHGAVIGKTGNTGASTGSHLHLECMADGEYYNPLFYFENGNGSIYGTTDPIGGSGDVAALIAEAENYLGYPYVWGGSSPSTSFDCSGFVCYVLTHSGFYNMPRTTAQGIYNQCIHISPSEARAGDLIFFTGTYSSGNPVTHVGIYAGGGQMIHCGDPIKYASINTPYWQNHFYAFARLPGH